MDKILFFLMIIYTILGLIMVFSASSMTAVLQYGYNEYLRIINDTADPEYDHILNWSKITRAEEKTDEEINRSLSWIK
jgi:hypothetical protein